MLYIVKYTGPFGYIKPWTAVRDEKTFSQPFLTPSIVAGMSQKLFGLEASDRILRHRLSYDRMDVQQEVVWPKWRKKPDARSILNRGVMLHPHLYLAFGTEADAQTAFVQHLCLCRNEDIVLPEPQYGIKALDETAFDALPGFELRFDTPQHLEAGFPVGYDRYSPEKRLMRGLLEIFGNPVRAQEL